MSLNFDAAREFVESASDIETLLEYAIKERASDNEKNRRLFLKLAVVSAVTKFQIFIENSLKEYHFRLTTSEKLNHELSINIRLNSLKIYSSEVLLHKKLANYETYNDEKLDEIINIIDQLRSYCTKETEVDENLKFETKFPLGKTGLEELIKLFRQINGVNIFEDPPFDINKLNEILGRRHAIIHEDSNPQITEETVLAYKLYLIEFVEYIDTYLSSNL